MTGPGELARASSLRDLPAPQFLAAISTPFAADGSVALDAFAAHVA